LRIAEPSPYLRFQSCETTSNKSGIYTTRQKFQYIWDLLAHGSKMSDKSKIALHFENPSPSGICLLMVQKLQTNLGLHRPFKKFITKILLYSIYSLRAVCILVGVHRLFYKYTNMSPSIHPSQPNYLYNRPCPICLVQLVRSIQPSVQHPEYPL
jgi:hypothetical protein